MIIFKIKLYGDNSVGKSCLLSRWTEDRYTEAYISTIGIDSKTINIKLNDKTVKMQIWDTNISAPKSAYERGFHAVIFVVDITDRLSLINLDKPLQKFKKENMPNTNKILVVSKADLENERQLEMCELEAYAQQHGMVGPIVTSAKTGQGVNLAFEMTAKVVLERITKNNSSTNVKSPSPSPSNNDNNNNDNNEEQSCLVM
ncbi:MAG: GTP-binding protein [Coxiellaceae bacterium]|nr:MAG: GTP-binding protein [Coxiellaceae bacterium]